jgi:hypothetical protein
MADRQIYQDLLTIGWLAVRPKVPMMPKISHSMRIAAVALLWLGLTSTVAHAHGGIAGPDELGPPVITSVILGIACYYIVIFWPQRRRRDVKPRLKNR